MNLSCTDFDSFTGGTLRCNPDTCTFDLSSCIPPTTVAVCGNNILESGEQCEGSGSVRSCDLFSGFMGGNAVCNDCQYDFSNCKPAPVCGNSKLEGLEQCDANKLGSMNCSKIDSFIGGTLGCSNDCIWDVTNCDKGPGYCGDNLVNNFPNEACDGNDWGKISKSNNLGCQEFGFDGGKLTCNNKCVFDTTLCSSPAPTGICGDMVLNPGEDCEPTIPLNVNCTDFDHFIGGKLKCNNDCKLDFSSCQQLTVSVCGDGYIDGAEQCDGSNLGPTTECSQIDSRFLGGALSCKNDCTYDLSSCQLASEPAPVCGNNLLESGEQCDGTATMSLTCKSFGFNSGTLSCGLGCMVTTENCVANETAINVCGDNLTSPGEQCDKSNIGNSDWTTILQCNEGVNCDGECKLRCGGEQNPSGGTESPNHCFNNVQDVDETGLDCGGSCKECENISCTTNEECASGKCGIPENLSVSTTESEGSICLAGHCGNNVQDMGEIGIDCGGSCGICSVEKSTCLIDQDCLSGKCDNGTCINAETAVTPGGVKTSGLVILLIGILCSLGGGGYIVYKTYLEKPKHQKMPPPMMSKSVSQSKSSENILSKGPSMGIKTTKSAPAREISGKEERKSMMKNFDAPEEKPVLKRFDTPKIESRPGIEKPLQSKVQDEFITLEELGSKESKVSKPDAKSRKIGANEQQAVTRTVSESRAVKDDKDEVFSKLSKITTDKKDDITKKIAELSGKPESKIMSILSSEAISSTDALTVFGNLDRDKIMSDSFKKVLSNLVSSKKLSSTAVSDILFEYIDKGTLSKRDVAKIMSEIKLV